MVTGKGRASAEISLRHFGVVDYFNRVEVGLPDCPIKPQGIRAILDSWTASVEECAYVGDTPYDMQAAAEGGVCGLGAAWARTATVTHDAPARPAAIFSHIDELMDWIDRHCEPTIRPETLDAPPGI